MYVRLLRLFSLKKISSSLWEKTLSEDSSDMEKFVLLMRKICESEWVLTPPEEVLGISLALLRSLPVIQESILWWEPFFPPGLSTSTWQEGKKHPTLSDGIIPMNVFQHSRVFPWRFRGMGWAWAQWVLHLTVVDSPGTSLWYQSLRGLESDFVQESFLGESSWLQSQFGVMNYMRSQSSLWLLCSNHGTPSPESRVRKMSLWTAVGLLSLQIFLKQDIPPGVRMLSLQCLECHFT